MVYVRNAQHFEKTAYIKPLKNWSVLHPLKRVALVFFFCALDDLLDAAKYELCPKFSF